MSFRMSHIVLLTAFASMVFAEITAKARGDLFTPSEKGAPFDAPPWEGKLLTTIPRYRMFKVAVAEEAVSRQFTST